MARFYVGQPVVCVWEPERWLEGVPIMFILMGIAIPRMGSRYRVSEYCPETGHHVRVSEMPPNHDAWYCEDGFEPLTENQVQAIIAQATDVPELEETS